MFRVLTVAREFGSGGSTISRIIAERLGWRLFDREIIDEVVRLAGVDRDSAERCDERLDPVFHRFLKGLWQGGFEQSTAQIGDQPFDAEQMTRCARVVVEQAAAGGNCVIVGRGGQCLLSGRDDTVNVFVWAPRDARIARIHARLPKEREPERLMDKMDRERSAFIRREFNANWCDHRLYDLIINSALGDEVAADCIISVLKSGVTAHA
jgi:cytidylate kinase